jgi:hypothetical protein
LIPSSFVVDGVLVGIPTSIVGTSGAPGIA